MVGQEPSIWGCEIIHACAECVWQRWQLVKPRQSAGQMRERGKHFKTFKEFKIGIHYGWNVYRSMENLRKFSMSPADAR